VFRGRAAAVKNTRLSFHGCDSYFASLPVNCQLNAQMCTVTIYRSLPASSSSFLHQVFVLLLRTREGVQYCINVSACLSVRSCVSKTTYPNFTKFSVRVAYGRGCFLLSRQCNTFSTSGFVDDFIVSHNKTYGVRRGLHPRDASQRKATQRGAKLGRFSSAPLCVASR